MKVGERSARCWGREGGGFLYTGKDGTGQQRQQSVHEESIFGIGGERTNEAIDEGPNPTLRARTGELKKLQWKRGKRDERNLLRVVIESRVCSGCGPITARAAPLFAFAL